jgi:hypothetical protein
VVLAGSVAGFVVAGGRVGIGSFVGSVVAGGLVGVVDGSLVGSVVAGGLVGGEVATSDGGT